MIVIHTFTGTFGLSEEVVNIILDDGLLSAFTAIGGTPRVTYDSFSPDLAIGTEIFRQTVDEGGGDWIEYVAEWNNVYPFATLDQTVVDPPVTPDVNIFDVDVTNETAAGLNDGTATIYATGGTAPYEYSINGVDYQSLTLFSNLAPGDYLAFVKDADDEIATYAFTIAPADTPAPPPIVDETKDLHVLAGAEISIGNGVKRVEVLTTFGKVPSIIANGDFEKWDGFNFLFWTRYGGINISRIQRTVTNTQGLQVPILNYALQFNQKADSGKWMQPSQIAVQKGDTIKVQYKVSKTDTQTTVTEYPFNPGGFGGGVLTKKLRTFYACKIRVNVGTYYLTNPNYGNSYEWVNSLVTINNVVENPDGDLNSYSQNFNIPECPVAGVMTIQFYGFTKVLQDTVTFSNTNATLDRPETIFTELNEYSPIAIDDVSLNKSSQSNDNDYEGILSVSENLGFYTEKRERMEILFGDYIIRTPGQNVLDDLYAIQYSGKNTVGWFEFGVTTNPVPFGQSLAKAILRAYQKPFKYWKGGFKLTQTAPFFSSLDVIRFDVPGQPTFSNKLFAVMGGDYDGKNDMANLQLSEVFDKPVNSNDITVPYFPGSATPQFTQDQNGNLNNIGIFTDEFTSEFS